MSNRIRITGPPDKVKSKSVSFFELGISQEELKRCSILSVPRSIIYNPKKKSGKVKCEILNRNWQDSRTMVVYIKPII